MTIAPLLMAKQWTEINTKNFNAMMGELGRIDGLDFEKTIRNQAGIILAKVISKTKLASKAKIRASANKHVDAKGVKAGGWTLTTNTGKRGNKGVQWFGSPDRKFSLVRTGPQGRTANTYAASKVFGKKTKPFKRKRLPTERAGLLKQARAEVRAKKKRIYSKRILRRGLAIASWIKLARDVKAPLGTVSGAKLSAGNAALANAPPSFLRSVKALAGGAGPIFSINLSSRAQAALNESVGGVAKFKYVMNAQAKGFATAMRYAKGNKVKQMIAAKRFGAVVKVT